MQMEEKMSLPTFVMVKSEFLRRYLEIGSLTDNVLSFVGEEPLELRGKFEVVPATTVGGGLVHIKSTENGKYWVLGPAICTTPIFNLDNCVRSIVAAADQPEEDKAQPSCTLFRPFFLKDGTQQKIRLGNVHLGRLVYTMSCGYADNCLVTGGPRIEEEEGNVFTIISWDSVVVPQYVAFKGDDGFYLRARTLDQKPYLQFSTSNIDDPGVMNHLIKSGGSMCIRNTTYNKYWRRVNEWIFADADECAGDPDTHFEIVKVGDRDKHIALLNLGNNLFCKRTNKVSIPHDALAADAAAAVVPETHMEMQELPPPS